MLIIMLDKNMKDIIISNNKAIVNIFKIMSFGASIKIYLLIK